MSDARPHPDTSPSLPLEEGIAAEIDHNLAEPAVEPAAGSSIGRTRAIDLKGRTLREHSARGTMINTGFMIGLSTIGLIRGFMLAAFLTAADYGVWGILAVSLGTVLWLKQVGIGDKYLQQDEEDQELAFQKAFTLEAMFTGIFCVILLALVPVVVLVYGEPKLLAPGLVIVALLPAGVLQAPLWVYYRNMDFLRQRILQSIDPLVGFVVALTCAIAGAGYWALAAGVLSGAWVSALVVATHSPYKLRFRYDRGTMSSYFAFSWPLFVSNGSSLVIAQSAVIAAESKVGLAGAGAMSLASSINSYTQRVDGLITGTLYPAICAVRDRIDLLKESFVKSNRLSLMWAAPFGTALALFISDLITFVLGEKWRGAADLISITGFNAAIGHIAYNWDAYMRATNRTRPMMVSAVASMVTFVALGIPLLLHYGLRGLAVGIVLQTIANIVCRVYFLRQLFDGFSYMRQATRAILPVLPGIGLVLIARYLESGERTAVMVVSELIGFFLVVAVGTWFLEGPLLREAFGYLRRARQKA